MLQQRACLIDESCARNRRRTRPSERNASYRNQRRDRAERGTKNPILGKSGNGRYSRGRKADDDVGTGQTDDEHVGHGAERRSARDGQDDARVAQRPQNDDREVETADDDHHPRPRRQVVSVPPKVVVYTAARPVVHSTEKSLFTLGRSLTLMRLQALRDEHRYDATSPTRALLAPCKLL